MFTEHCHGDHVKDALMGGKTSTRRNRYAYRISVEMPGWKLPFGEPRLRYVAA
jgi:hypothetical protein